MKIKFKKEMDLILFLYNIVKYIFSELKEIEGYMRYFSKDIPNSIFVKYNQKIESRFFTLQIKNEIGSDGPNCV